MQYLYIYIYIYIYVNAYVEKNPMHMKPIRHKEMITMTKLNHEINV